MNPGIPAARFAPLTQARKHLLPINTASGIQGFRGFQQFSFQLRKRIHGEFFEQGFLFQQSQPVTQDFAGGLLIATVDFILHEMFPLLSKRHIPNFHVSYGADDKTTRHNAGSQMPGCVHALV
jgi:hypothetical protein